MRPPTDSSSGRRRQGRYELGDLLGRGGMAEVFAGSSMGDHGFQKPVAIKRLLPELANDEVFVERLIGEAKLLVGMQHGNIVSVLDLARDGDDVFLVMEFVDGPSLRQLMKGRGPRGLSFGITTYIIATAAAGLEFAHVRPGGAVIHADISPSNLLLTTSGEVRVADFGIARREGGGESHGVEGKWAYMAPEQARGERLSPSSDVFALGIVMYELLTGQHPLGHQITATDRSSEPLRVIPPRVVKPSVPPGLDAICMRALAVDAKDRYPSMQAVIDAVTDERFANGYREGASDLAQAIREIATVPSSPVVHQARTQITDRPVTIVTRSLLSSPNQLAMMTTPNRSSSPSVSSVPMAIGTQHARGSMPSIPVGPGTLTEFPSIGQAAPVAQPATKSRWAFVILGAAAVVGVVAAAVIQMGPSGLEGQPAKIAASPSADVPANTIPMPALAEPTALAPTVPTVAPIAPIAPIAPVTPAEPIASPTIAAKAKVIARKKEVGTFDLRAGSWVKASIDGGPNQDVSSFRKFSLAAGKHMVRISNDELGYKPITRSFVIEPNKSRVLKVDLESGSVKEN